MPESAPTTSIPSVTISVVIVGATVVFGGLGALACWLADVTPASSGSLGLIAALAGASAGIAPWLLRGHLSVVHAAANQLISVSLRMIVGLSVALALLLVTEVDNRWLLGVFLIATLAGLAAELLVLTPALKRSNALNSTPHAPNSPNVPETAG